MSIPRALEREREVGDTKNSVVKTEVSNTENFAIESEYEST